MSKGHSTGKGHAVIVLSEIPRCKFLVCWLHPTSFLQWMSWAASSFPAGPPAALSREERSSKQLLPLNCKRSLKDSF